MQAFATLYSNFDIKSIEKTYERLRGQDLACNEISVLDQVYQGRVGFLENLIYCDPKVLFVLANDKKSPVLKKFVQDASLSNRFVAKIRTSVD